MKLSEKVKYLREKNNLSQSKLAELSKVSISTILKIENDEQINPHPLILKAISKSLGISYIDLYFKAGYIDEDLIYILKQSKRLMQIISSLRDDNMDSKLDKLLQGMD